MIQRDQNRAASASNELVINWHLTEACNYGCRYCYSKWHAATRDRELIHDRDASRAMLEAIYRDFAPDNIDMQARLGMSWKKLRLSLAGGEPLLYERELVRLARQAREIGFELSLITNGSRLTRPLMAELAPLLSVLDISIDSASALTNREIGRIDRHSRLLSLTALREVIADGRRLNPTLRIKINTVVNALNFTEDQHPTITQLAPDKWKVLRMLPTVTSDLAIADHEFAEFVDRHRSLAAIMAAEDNTDMVESYIMIDPRGRFFQNSLSGQGYRYSNPITEVGAQAAFRQVQWHADKFLARYTLERQEVSQ